MISNPKRCTLVAALTILGAAAGTAHAAGLRGLDDKRWRQFPGVSDPEFGFGSGEAAASSDK